MSKRYIGVFHIETPLGKRESYQVRPKKAEHFRSERSALAAARRMQHIKLQGSRKYPIGSRAIASAEPVSKKDRGLFF